MISDIAGAIPLDQASDPVMTWVILAVALSLAALGIKAAFRLSGRRLWGYATALATCAAVGTWGAAESGGFASLGFAVGLGASVLGAPVLGAIKDRIQKGRK